LIAGSLAKLARIFVSLSEGNTMKRLRFSTVVAAIALIAGSVGSAQAAVFTEDFEGAFPAWESNWFGTQSTGRNFYCNGALGCASRGNNPGVKDGMEMLGRPLDQALPIDSVNRTGVSELPAIALSTCGSCSAA
jgi:hypothetical protein